MCYTSAPRASRRASLYSHRSNILHALTKTAPDFFGLSCRDVVMPVVPLFHANSWSLASPRRWPGAALVLPGPKLDGASIHELLESEGVTFTAGRADRLAGPAPTPVSDGRRAVDPRSAS